MLKSRLFEEAIAQLWHDGLISGEMHLGTGEEAIIAGVISHLLEGDAMALDHRGSAALLMRGVDPVLILRELLGYPDGLCGGMGGHMHLLSKEHLAASSGIIGAAGPTAAGFALAAQYLRPGQSEQVTGGALNDRARGLGIPAVEVDGLDVSAVWEAAHEAMENIRSGKGPTFLHARCVHLEGHFLGYQLLRIVRAPFREMPEITVPLTRSFLRPGGANLRERLSGLKTVIATVLSTVRDPRQDQTNDPVSHARAALQSDLARLRELEDQIEKEISNVLASALEEVPS
jgi:pyruvate dehydrogenase E1 component alpha subunit